MKPKSLAFLALLALSMPARSEEQAAALSPARILGTIPDGTPAPPSPAQPPFVVAKSDIVSTTTHREDERTITVREIKPIDLPEPTEKAPLPADLSPAVRAQIADYRATHPINETLFISATVYRSKNSPPRSLVHFHRLPNQEKITFWSSADFALIAGGIHSFFDTSGKAHTIFMSWGNVDTNPKTELKSSRIRQVVVPEIPDLPEGKATFLISDNQPTANDQMVIQSLHDIYNKEHERLITAYQGREFARLQQQADLKAHPPKPKDITLNYWRTETPSNTAKGDNQ